MTPEKEKSPSNGDAWLTVSEAANLSGYNPEYITRLIRAGTLQGRKVSIVWLVDRQSLMTYLAKTQAMGEKRGPKPQT
jgi:excisionase family DNA binding protein